MDIPPYPTADGKGDITTSRNSAYPACRLAETPRRRYSGEMFEVVALMQFWKDETMPFQYGGIVRHDSKVLLYVMFRLKAVLKTVDFKFHHYAVKAMTTWNDYTRENLTSEQVVADRKAHQKMHDELTALKNWMQHHYQEEADLGLEILQRIQGDVDRLLVHRQDRCHHPGNEKEYH